MSYTKDRIAKKRAESAEYRAAYDEEVESLAQEQARRAELMRQVAAFRKKQHLTQIMLAERMRVTQSRVSQIERGEETFSVDSLLSMIEALGLRMVILPAESESVAAPAVKRRYSR